MLREPRAHVQFMWAQSEPFLSAALSPYESFAWTESRNVALFNVVQSHECALEMLQPLGRRHSV
jgi:hypothetical protein